MIAQPYPLWLAIVGDQARDLEEIRSLRARVTLLSSRTRRVVAWAEEEDERGTVSLFPVMVPDGTPSAAGFPFPNLSGEGAFFFYGETKREALVKALRSCYQGGMPNNWDSAVRDVLA